MNALPPRSPLKLTLLLVLLSLTQAGSAVEPYTSAKFSNRLIIIDPESAYYGYELGMLCTWLLKDVDAIKNTVLCNCAVDVTFPSINASPKLRFPVVPAKIDIHHKNNELGITLFKTSKQQKEPIQSFLMPVEDVFSLYDGDLANMPIALETLVIRGVTVVMNDEIITSKPNGEGIIYEAWSNEAFIQK